MVQKDFSNKFLLNNGFCHFSIEENNINFSFIEAESEQIVDHFQIYKKQLEKIEIEEVSSILMNVNVYDPIATDNFEVVNFRTEQDQLESVSSKLFASEENDLLVQSDLS